MFAARAEAVYSMLLSLSLIVDCFVIDEKGGRENGRGRVLFPTHFYWSDARCVCDRAITAAARNLTTKLRAASALPLRVVSVQPLSAALRDTAAFPPLVHPLATAKLSGGADGGDLGRVPRCLEPLELLVQLEGSGKICLFPLTTVYKYTAREKEGVHWI